MLKVFVDMFLWPIIYSKNMLNKTKNIYFRENQIIFFAFNVSLAGVIDDD
jgi:hypothetical protein